MPEHTRRAFLVGAGTAAATVSGVTVPAVARTGGATAGGGGAGDAATQLVVYIGDPQSGEITLMRGQHETVVRDRRLAAALTRLAG